MAQEVNSDPERKTIDLDTWHEMCRRREAGQPLEIPNEPLERRPIHTETPGQMLGREIERQIILNSDDFSAFLKSSERTRV